MIKINDDRTHEYGDINIDKCDTCIYKLKALCAVSDEILSRNNEFREESREKN